LEPKGRLLRLPQTPAYPKGAIQHRGGLWGRVLSSLWLSSSEDTAVLPSWLLFFIPSHLGVPFSSWTPKHLFTEPQDLLTRPLFRCRSKAPGGQMVGFFLAGAAAPTWWPWGAPAGSLPHPARPPLPPSNHHALSAGTPPATGLLVVGRAGLPSPDEEGCFVSSQA